MLIIVEKHGIHIFRSLKLFNLVSNIFFFCLFNKLFYPQILWIHHDPVLISCDIMIQFFFMFSTLLVYFLSNIPSFCFMVDPSLHLIPFHPDDTLTSYGFKLCNIDHKIGYSWFAKIFSGFTLTQLKEWVDELFALNGRVIQCKYWKNYQLVNYLPESPRIYPAQRELINTLQANGIEVYIITAALEELTRMIVSDPKYGLNVKPENVIGISCLLKNRKTQEVTTARKQIAEGHFWDEKFSKEDHYAMEVIPCTLSPDPLYIGKLAVLKEYIHPIKQPILVAGWSRSGRTRRSGQNAASASRA